MYIRSKNVRIVLTKLFSLVAVFALSALPVLATENTSSQAKVTRSRDNQVISSEVVAKSLNIVGEPKAQSDPVTLSAHTNHSEIVPNISRQRLGFNLNYEHAQSEILIKYADWADDSLKAQTVSEFKAEKLSDNLSPFERIKIDLEKLRPPRLDEAGSPRDVKKQVTEVSFDDVLNVLNALPHIEWAEPDYIAKALAVPTDPHYKLQWNFPLIGLEPAWDKAQGRNVTVAIIDTGVAYENWSLYKQATDLAATQFVPGYNFVLNNTHPNDDNGHGTHIAGTIAGSTNNNEGVAGIAYLAKIMPIKVLDRAGSGTYSNIAQAIRFAADNGADIINLSLGGPAMGNVMEEALAYAAGKNVLVVAASGNDGSGQVLYPAAYNDSVLAVGAVRFDKQKSPYSSYGTALDLVAPGGDTNVNQNGDSQPDGILQQTLQQNPWGANPTGFGYYFYQGTSMAAPHVAGVAALVKSLGIDQASQIRQILTASAEDLSSAGWDAKTGFGLVRADKAVAMALEQLASGQTGTAANNSNTAPANPATSQPANNQPVPEQVPVTEPAPVADPQLLDMSVETGLYNAWGRLATTFSFWENAALSMAVKDNVGKALAGASLNVDIYNTANKKLVAKGQGPSDAEGELWIGLGNFAKGTYEVVVTAIKDGYKEVIKKVTFRFR